MVKKIIYLEEQLRIAQMVIINKKKLMKVNMKGVKRQE
jgi:hypothetical protein